MWIFNLIQLILSLWLKRPNPLVQESEKVGQAEQALQTEVETNEQVQKANTAAVIVGRTIDTDDKLRIYESTDPNNRDNE